MSELKSKFVSRNSDVRPGRLSLDNLIQTYIEEISFGGLALLALILICACSTSVIGHWLTSQTNESISRKSYEDSLQKLNFVLVLDPFSDDALLNRGRIFTKLHKYKEALNDYSAVLQHNPNRIDALERRAALCVAMNKSDQVLADCNALLKIQGDKASVYTYADRAIAYSMQGKKQECFDDYSSAIRMKPTEKDFYLGRADCLRDMGNYSDALEDYEWVQMLRPGDEDAFIGKASCFSLQKNYPKAFSCLDQAIDAKLKSPKLFLARGKLFWATNQIDNALKDFNSALALDSKNVDALTERMRVHIFRQDEEKALQDVNLLVQLGATNYNIYLKRSDLQFDLGKFALASMGYDLASELKPGEAEPLIQKAKAEAAQKHFTLAVQMINSALKLRPSDPELIAQRGMYSSQAGDTDGAKGDFDKALALNENLIHGYLYRGEVAYQQRDYVSAKEDFAKVLRLDPKSVDGKFYLSQTNQQLALVKRGASVASLSSNDSTASSDPKLKKILADGNYNELSTAGASAYQVGRYRDAISLLSKAVKLNPSMVEPRRYLAASLLACNYLPEAAVQYKSVISLEPGNESDLAELGKALFDSHQYADAIDVYNKILQVKPHDTAATRQIILAYKATGMVKKAQEICIDAIHSTTGIEDLQQYENLLKSFNSSSGPKVAPIKDSLDIRG